MVRVHDHLVFARQQPRHQQSKVSVAQRHMRRPERRHDIHTHRFQIGAAEHRDHRESHETRLAKRIDLLCVARIERRNPVTTPLGEPFVKPFGVLRQRYRIELIAP
jgi:hypothetical protein